MSSTHPVAESPPSDGTRRSWSEFVVVAVLAVLGTWAIVDSLGIDDSASRGVISARTVPIVVGLLLIAMAVLLAVDVLRGGHGEQEGGEDVDLAGGADLKTVGLLVVAFAFNAAFIDSLGWPLTGAIMFFLSTLALGGRHLIRTAIISIIMSVGSWYLFYLGLGIHLPAGLLQGVL